MKKPIRLFIADDHHLMLEGLASLIGSIEGLELTGKFASGRDLLDTLLKTVRLPDVCLIDIEMPGIDGIETVRLIREKFVDMKIMALTMHDEQHFVNRMIVAGANGYVLKNVKRQSFIDSINRVMSGNSFVIEGLAHKKVNVPDDELTDREKDILKQIVLGKSNKEISAELYISDRTVDTHRTNIKRKLKLTTLSQLMQYAKEHGLS
ncbi:response regulator transcription factor [Chryseolinea sp. T2]|uniref:response regulator transcription factor n=1 Tax=Chryseolinea sp. T2 TaxID=3129255 RepID=UPI003077DAC7